MIITMIYIYIDLIRKYAGMLLNEQIGTDLVVEVGNWKKTA